MSAEPLSGDDRVTTRIAMPHQLLDLARVAGEVDLEVDAPVTLGAVLDALETAHPALRGAIRDRRTKRRRA